MWPIPALEHTFVSVIFSPEAIVCSWIEKNEKQLILRAYQRYPLDNLELTNLIIYNPSLIKKHITSFLSQYNLKNAFVSFVLNGPSIIEQFVAMPTSTPHRSDFAIANNASMLWEYRYIYSNDHGQYIFYLYSVPRSLVLQYKLLAIAAGCNLITITTQTMALLSAYKNIFGAAYRRSQLAVDMMRCNNNVADLIKMDALRRMINGLPAETLVKEGAAAAGAFCSERFNL